MNGATPRTTGCSTDRTGPDPGSGRWRVAVGRLADTHLAEMELDESLRRHGTLVESAAAAAGLALEVQQQITEISASRSRIATAALEERRRLERDLHDGVQQTLLAATASLSAARIRVARHLDPDEAIDRAGDDLQRALLELRQLARGTYPAILGQSGLRAAVESVAERLPVEVHLQTPVTRWDSRVESTLYFVICEALTNTVKHAQATRVDIRLGNDGGTIRCRIVDDGRGGAVVVAGSGLSGVSDRVSAMGGTLSISGPDPRGTTIEVRIPCE